MRFVVGLGFELDCGDAEVLHSGLKVTENERRDNGLEVELGRLYWILGMMAV